MGASKLGPQLSQVKDQSADTLLNPWANSRRPPESKVLSFQLMKVLDFGDGMAGEGRMSAEHCQAKGNILGKMFALTFCLIGQLNDLVPSITAL